ncbi:hypothetical protein [Niallia sp. Krafla_26]|uniref:hypothetical protein n=1 Tax=Niallia sp. Krafla_26 TaxID=3064703 RepID=UPI003D186E69
MATTDTWFSAVWLITRDLSTFHLLKNRDQAVIHDHGSYVSIDKNVAKRPEPSPCFISL